MRNAETIDQVENVIPFLGNVTFDRLARSQGFQFLESYDALFYSFNTGIST